MNSVMFWNITLTNPMISLSCMAYRNAIAKGHIASSKAITVSGIKQRKQGTDVKTMIN